MNRFILVIISLLFASCQTESNLFVDIEKIAKFNIKYNPILIQSGDESGFLEPLMEYNLYKIDTITFDNLEKTILTSNKFKEWTYYLNIELDDYLQENKLDIINMSKSSISENHYDKNYYFYLLSDRKTFAIFKVNN